MDPVLEAAVKQAHEAFHAAMDDDFHSPGAVAAIFELQRAANAALDGPVTSPLGSKAAKKALTMYETMGGMLTLFQDPIADEAPDFEALLHEREAARAAKDWATADRIRDEIAAAGYVIQDTPNGPRVEKA